MKLTCNLLIVAVLAIAGVAFAAVPQGNRDNRDKPAYDDGYRQGRDDAARHRGQNVNCGNWHTGHERHACQDGYSAGYQAGGRDYRGDRDRDRDRDGDRDRDRDRDRNNNSGYNNGQYRGGNNPWEQARQVGYQDGVADGRSDRATGHSYRPTHDDNYKNASRGYVSSMGDKQTYKNAYREGYARGYPEGYNGRR